MTSQAPSAPYLNIVHASTPGIQHEEGEVQILLGTPPEKFTCYSFYKKEYKRFK